MEITRSLKFISATVPVALLGLPSYRYMNSVAGGVKVIEN
jgi:hypothetical protein